MKTASEREQARLHARDEALLNPIQEVFTRVRHTFPGVLPCGRGCSACCVASFHITLLDLWRLWRGWPHLDPDLREQLVLSSREVIKPLRQADPGWDYPYDLRDLTRPALHTFIREVRPCPALGEAGECTVYPVRPRLCHLQGLSYVDPGGGVELPDYCAVVFGDPPYAALPPQPLNLWDQWEMEEELRSQVGPFLPENLEKGYVTLVAGAILVVDRWT